MIQSPVSIITEVSGHFFFYDGLQQLMRALLKDASRPAGELATTLSMPPKGGDVTTIRTSLDDPASDDPVVSGLPDHRSVWPFLRRITAVNAALLKEKPRLAGEKLLLQQYPCRQVVKENNVQDITG